MSSQLKYASLLQTLFPNHDQENYQFVVSRAQAVAKSHAINMSDPFTFSNFPVIFTKGMATKYKDSQISQKHGYW